MTKKSKKLQEEITKFMDKHNISGYLLVPTIGCVKYVHNHGDEVLLLDFAKTEALYEEKKRELKVIDWIRTDGSPVELEILEKKQSYIQ